MPRYGSVGRREKSHQHLHGHGLLNVFLRPAYGLDRFENVLEVPLDNTVVKKLRKFGRTQKVFPRAEFPKWESIKKLDPTNSAKHQQIADVMSAQRGIPRGRLDVALF
jgi:hypothetical protein